MSCPSCIYTDLVAFGGDYLCPHCGWRDRICGAADPLVAGGRCTEDAGHAGWHRNNTGFFWAGMEKQP